jgi:alkanesulfonate monooxygenase SsuD/methylene tetrahydromethanopterin reductase-like flavin-dependent oxidoreductase (luciferase family)
VSPQFELAAIVHSDDVGVLRRQPDLPRNRLIGGQLRRRQLWLAHPSRWAELIFTGDPGLEVARSHYADQKERIGEAGRDPAAVRICPMAYAVVGESEAHAKDREALLLNDLVHPMASLTLLSELMNYDFAQHDLDDPVTDELVASVSGIRGLVQNQRPSNTWVPAGANA